MKRCQILTVFLIFLGFVVANPALALLIDNGDGTVTDDDLGIMWLQTPGPDANYSDAALWADNLVFAGYDDWRLPSALDFETGLPDTGYNSVNNELGHLYGSELGNPPSPVAPMSDYDVLWYWTGTVDPNHTDDVFVFAWTYDNLWENYSTWERPDVSLNSVINATAVRIIGDGDDNGNGGDDTQQVPEPGTFLFLGTIMFGLCITYRKKLVRK